jgi:hypothetical protein
MAAHASERRAYKRDPPPPALPHTPCTCDSSRVRLLSNMHAVRTKSCALLPVTSAPMRLKASAVANMCAAASLLQRFWQVGGGGGGGEKVWVGVGCGGGIVTRGGWLAHHTRGDRGECVAVGRLIPRAHDI